MSRLPPPWGSIIDRDRTIRFRFEGMEYQGFAGDTIASALAANGVRVLSRSFKYHRPRGIHSMANQDANALVQLSGEPNVPAELRPVEEGMEVWGQNYAGSLKRDRRRWLQHLGRFLPAGFYYRAFYKPQGAWRFWEPRIREMAGLGRVDLDDPSGYFDKAYAFCDVAVVGGGLAGVSAALQAARAGADVRLIDNGNALGGWLRFARPVAARETAETELASLVGEVEAEARIAVMTGAIANGWFADHWLPVLQGNRLIKLRARATVVAAGAMEQPMVFRQNDLPGIMLGSAAQRLIRLYGVRPGRRAVVATANGDGYGVALDLHEAGIEVVAVIDLREQPGDDDRVEEVRRCGIPVRTGTTVQEAEATADGDGLAAVRTGRVDAGVPGEREERLACDLLCVSVGAMPMAHLALQAGCRLSYDAALASFRIAGDPPAVFRAGAVNGQMGLAGAMADGALAGARAAEAAGFTALPPNPPSPPEPYNHAYPVVPHPKGKDFVDFDEDQTHGDILQALEEGFEHVELLKRYTTIGMGPSQGRHAALNTARILARHRDLPVDAVGVTTWRPPYTEESFGHLAGRGFHPARRTALHDRHLELGAEMMPAGLWYRPAWYGGRSEREQAIAREVTAVRQNVGLIDVSTLGGLEVRGPDAAAFMERIYTFAYRRQPVGRSRYVLACDATGAVIDDGVACRLAEEHFYVTATTGAVDLLYRQMLWWNAQWRMAVDVANVTAAWAGINLAGPRARDVLSRLEGDIALEPDAFPYLAVRAGAIAGVPVRVLRVGFVGELCYELHAPAGLGEALWDALMDAGADFDMRPFGVEAQRVLRLEKGHVIVGQDTDGLTYPHEAGLDWAVSDRKLRYVGKQAIAARLARGLTRTLVGFKLDDGAPLPEECHLTVRGDEIIGRVTSTARSPTLGKAIGLAYVAPDQAAAGSRFEIKLSDATRVGATVVSLPFYDPGNARQEI